MPSDPDAWLEALKQIKTEFIELVQARGDVNEADTRANLIDKNPGSSLWLAQKVKSVGKQ